MPVYSCLWIPLPCPAQVVHKKTATALAITGVKNEDKAEFGRIVEAVKVSDCACLQCNLSVGRISLENVFFLAKAMRSVRG